MGMPGPLNHNALNAQSQPPSAQQPNGTSSQSIQGSAGQNVMLNAMPAAQDPQSVAVTQNPQATSSPPYYADQQPPSQSCDVVSPQQPNGSLTSSPISPHLQQPVSVAAQYN